MAVIPYRPYPTVEPGMPPFVPERIQAGPESFGGLVGAAEERGGARVQAAGAAEEQGANQLAGAATQSQLLYNEVTADQASYGMLDKAQGIWNDYHLKQGQDALDAHPQVVSDLQGLYDQTRGQLPNARAQMEFDAQTRRLHSIMLGQVDAHYDQQFKNYGVETQKLGEQVSLQGIAAAYNNPAAVEDWTNKLTQARVRQAQTIFGQNLSPENTAAIVATAKSDAIKAQVMAMSVHDPAGAAALAERERGALGVAYQPIADHLRTRTIDSQAWSIAYGTPIPTGTATATDWGIEHNNFGNIRKPGIIASPSAGGFEAYATPQEGVGAVRNLLLSYQDQHGLNTINGIVGRWSPPSENDTAALISRASRIVGVAPDQSLDLHDSGTMAKMVEATIRNEHGGAMPPAAAAALGAPPTAGMSAGEPGFAGQLTADAQPPGLSEKINQIMQGTEPDEVKQKAVQLVTTRYNAMWADSQRNYELQQRATKQASEDAEKSIVADSESGSPKITAQDISTNPALTAEARMRMIGFVQRQGKPDPLSRVSQQASIHLLDDIRRPDGDPQKITENGPIYDAYIAGRLTRPDRDDLLRQLADLRTPEGEKLGERVKEFANGMKASITKSNPLMGNTDPSGDQQFYLFNYNMQQRIAQYRKEGKNPFDLFDPAKPDYLGGAKALEQFQKPIADSLRDIVRNLNRPSTVPPSTAPAPAVTGVAPIPSAPTIAPRQSNESMTDYIRRVGVPLPAQGPPPTATPQVPVR